MRIVRLLVLSCFAFPYAGLVQAQNYPAKVVRYIVPGSAGSGADTIARIIAGGLADLFRQQVIVDNRPGGGGNIGAEIASQAPADGYAVLQITMTQATNVSLYRNLKYDLLRDFDAVTQLATTPYVVVVHPSLPVKSIKDLVRLAKAKPGALNYGSGGIGTPTFLAGELFKEAAGIDMLHVSYRGGGEAVTAAITGEAPILFGPVSTSLPHIRQGRLRALAVTSARRLPLLQDYPTISEAGYPGFEAGNWYGIVVPAKTPREAIMSIHGTVKSVLGRPAVKKRLNALAFFSVGSEPEAFSEYIRLQIDSIGKIVRALHLTAN